MRQDAGQQRQNALWGKRGEQRSNALWGSGKRGFLLLAVAAAVISPVAGSAHSTNPAAAAAGGPLVQKAAANPDQVFNVIVQARGHGNGHAADAIDNARKSHPGKGHGLERQFSIINGASAELTGAQIVDLAQSGDVSAITLDTPMTATGKGGGNGGGTKNPPTTTTTSTTCATCPYEGVYWPYITGMPQFWEKSGAKAAPAPQAPAIAIVDSGVDASNPIFGGRVVKQVTMTTLTPNAAGDGRGHGTFVAGLAAGMVGTSWGGASPTSKIVSLDVLNDKGKGMTSDVIAAADWIFQHKGEYGIRVANFSLHAEGDSNFVNDPLDAAVERLWLSGVVVVAAAGNYAEDGKQSGVLYAPANDPFVITVGSVDVNNTPEYTDDVASPWSAWGYTSDGFRKPELGAPGRYMVGAVPAGSTMPSDRPDRIVAPGYMWMSGTSFASPVAAGAAADLLALHPGWTPDQVKGALMTLAKPLPAAVPGSAGVGELNLNDASLMTSPPNPNAALNRFLVPDPLGGSTSVFDGASWAEAAHADASWDAASWAAASWSDASWADASWAEASWAEASWADGEDGTHSWPDLAWVN